jgi:PAS domain S-box-containing protein
MNAILDWLLDPSGPPARASCGDWSPGLLWLHVGSDLFLGLAYLAVPLVLLYFVRRRRDVRVHSLVWPFVLSLVACAFAHLVEVIGYYHPVANSSVVVKVAAAAAGWVAVAALVPAVPRLLDVLASVKWADGDSRLHRVPAARPPSRTREYIVAVLAAVLAVLVRRLLDPALGDLHPFVISLLAVIFVAWEGGFGPAMVTLLISTAGIVYWFVHPRGSWIIVGLPNQIGFGLFIFGGVMCGLLGEAQRFARARAERARDEALDRRAELEAEVVRRMSAETAVRESEERFRNLADSVPVLIWVADADRRRTYFNRSWLAFTGRPLAEQLGYGWEDNVHADDRDRYGRVYSAAFDSRESFEIEYRLRRHDGEYRWVLARGKPRFGPGGAFAGFVGLCIDITDRKGMEQDLRHSADRFRQLTEAIPQMVWNADAGGRVTYFNTRWREYTGLDAADALDDWWGQVIHPEDAPGLEAAWRHAVEVEAGSFTHEVRVRRHADGVYRWFLTAVVPLFRADGTLDQWIGSLSDIDDQKRQAETLERMVEARTEELEKANAALRGTAQELERSNRELEQFAYVASHDLQEPLRKIQAFGDRLRDRFRDQVGDQGREYIDRMLASAGRMRRLIDDLLAYSRLTTQARPFTRTDLNDVLHDVVEDLAARVEATGAGVEVGELPAVDADPSQIRQLFQNLLGNALKFLRPGVRPVVRVHAEPLVPGDDGSGYRISVTDNGIGFDPKYAGRIFQVFQRLHGRDEYEGTGVGLAICKKIVERHGGTIAAESEPGKGSTFVVTLPGQHFAAPASSGPGG